jgi:formate-dependent nitrite reductase membrane component NrfD
MQKGAIVLLLSLAFLLLFHMQATHRVPEGQRAAAILLRENHATLFWCGVVVFGIAVPLLLLALSISAGGSTLMVVAAAISGLFGSLCLRQAMLCGGVLARLKAGSFEYTVTNP